MAQIQKGDTFVDGQIVTGARLNQLVDSATVLPAIITDQTSLTSNTLATDDNLLIYDTSSTLLKKINASDILGSGLPITLNTINSTNYSDITLIPQVSNSTISATFTTSNSNKTIIVSSTSHGLQIGNWVWITGAESAYVGRYPVSAITTNTFTYNVGTAGTGSSGSLSWTKLGTVLIGDVSDKGNVGMKGNLYVDKNFVVTGNSTINGTLSVLGNSAVLPSLTTIGDKTPMTKEDNLTKIYVKYGVSSGATSPISTENTIYTLPTLPTIPSDETWIYEFYVMIVGGYMNGDTRPTNNTPSFYVYNDTTQLAVLESSEGCYGHHNNTFFYSLNGTTGAKYILKYKSQSNLSEEPRYMIRLTKLKTSTLSDASTCI